MLRNKMVDGVTVPFTPEEEAARDAEEATELANKPERAKNAANDRIRAQIVAKERLADRPVRELRRMQEWADVPLADVTAAKNRLKVLDDEIRALRAQLQP